MMWRNTPNQAGWWEGLCLHGQSWHVARAVQRPDVATRSPSSCGEQSPLWVIPASEACVTVASLLSVPRTSASFIPISR